MRRNTMLLGGAVGLGTWLARRYQRRSQADLTRPHLDEPQAPIERMEQEADIPGGVRP